LLDYLTDTKHDAPKKDVSKLYKMSDYMLDLLGKRIRRMDTVSRGGEESAAQEAAEIFKLMSGKVEVYRRELRSHMPGFKKELRKYIPLM